MTLPLSSTDITTIVGLGNPGPTHYYQRHNIGFRVLDALAQKYGASWHEQTQAHVATITHQSKKVTLVKPTTYMNSSGHAITPLLKKGVTAAHVLVVHDELEKPFGALAFKQGGSHRGHNGLRSIITIIGDNFLRLRFGIGRPQEKADVPNYVLALFDEEPIRVNTAINEAVMLVESALFS